MPRLIRHVFAGIILGLLIGVPWAYASWRNINYRNVHLVREGVLYRSGQLSLDGLKRLIHDRGIKTVVSLRFAHDPKDAAPDFDEERFCVQEEIRYHRLRHRAWEAPDGSVPVEANVTQFLEIMSDSDNYPVLVHCFAGIHRTGAFCALYRMEFENWSNARAIREMQELGYKDNHRDVFAYLERYRRRGVQVVQREHPAVICPTVHSQEPPLSSPVHE